MRQNLNPIVVGIVLGFVLLLLVIIGIKVFSGSGAGTKPQPLDYKIPPPAAHAVQSGSSGTP
jgi:ABC-type transporter Mla subunit MlaD